METKFSYRSAKWSSGKKLTCDVQDVAIREDDRELEFILNEQNPEAVEAFLIRDSLTTLFPLNLSKTFPNLAALSLNKCGLTEISRSDLIGLEGLVELDLSFNKLTTLPRDLLTDMKKLKFLDFSGNCIETLDARMFDGIKNQLQRLDLRKNGSIDNTFSRGQAQSIDEFLKTIATKSPKPEIDDKKTFPQKVMKGFQDIWLMLSRK